jgi:AcrR family transcriptional regulator
MCAAPAKTSEHDILQAARRIVHEHGIDELSMQALADQVGVRAPSLYKRFANRDAVLDVVAEQCLGDLGARLRRASRNLEGGAAISAMAKTYRDFAKRTPQLYKLLYTRRGEADELVKARADAVAPLLEVLAAVVERPEERLPAARMLTAFLHGFVSMEIDGAFKLGGDVATAFEYGLRRLVAAISGDGPAPA